MYAHAPKDLNRLFWVIIREGAIFFSRQYEGQRFLAKIYAPALTYGILLSHWTKMATTETAREKALANYRKKLLEHRELDARLKESMDIFTFAFRDFVSMINVIRNSSRYFTGSNITLWWMACIVRLQLSLLFPFLFDFFCCLWGENWPCWYKCLSW